CRSSSAACRCWAWPRPATRATSATRSGAISATTGSPPAWTGSAPAKPPSGSSRTCSHGCWPAARWAAPSCACDRFRRAPACRLLAGAPGAATIALTLSGKTRMARILIVDDSPSQLMGIRRIVEKLGHQAVTAEDGAAGVRAAKEHLPDPILMNVVMLSFNVIQSTLRIKRELESCHIAVSLITTKDLESGRVWGLRQGAQGYLTKPFSEAELTEA